MSTLLYLGILFVAGAMTEWLSFKLRFSSVVGYMIVGLLLAPGTFGVLPEAFIEKSHIIIDLALSLIAVLVGASLKRSRLKGLTAQVAAITAFEATFAFLSVATGFFLLGAFFFPQMDELLAPAILLGGIASATAPAATLAIIHELKAYGRFSTTLLAVVASDDAVAMILFAFALTLSSTLVGPGTFHFTAMLHALYIIAGSIGIGLLAGVVTTGFERLFSHHKGMETIATLGMIFIAYSLSRHFGLEPLLTTLTMGVVMANISSEFDLVEKEIDNHIVEIVFMLFFMLSAIHLDLGALLALPAAALGYVLLRIGGKVGGSYLGALLSGADRDVRRYLGFALFPQAGVAIGLALSLQDRSGFESFAPPILHLVIATTIIHELAGPFMTRFALLQAKKHQEKTNA